MSGRHNKAGPRKIGVIDCAPIRSALYHALQKTNLIPITKIAGSSQQYGHAVLVMREAGMVLYHEAKRIWVPDVGTYDWLVKQRERMLCKTT